MQSLGCAGHAESLTHECNPDRLAAGKLCEGPPCSGRLASIGHQRTRHVPTAEREVVAACSQRIGCGSAYTCQAGGAINAGTSITTAADAIVTCRLGRFRLHACWANVH